MTVSRIPITPEHAAAFDRALREYREEFARRGLHELIDPDPSECPPQAGCPECGAPAENVTQALYRMDPPGPQLRLEIDVDPCGHRLEGIVPGDWDFSGDAETEWQRAARLYEERLKPRAEEIAEQMTALLPTEMRDAGLHFAWGPESSEKGQQ